MKSLPFVLLLLCLCLLGGCIADCTCGYTTYKHGKVVNKVYTPPDTDVDIDPDGHVSVTTTPAKWTVVFLVDSEHEVGINVSMEAYDSYNVGYECPIGQRVGAWTRITYSAFIAHGATLDKDLQVEK